MSTKIVAARLAASAGVTTVIARSSNPKNIFSIVQYIQTLGLPRNKSLSVLNPASASGAPNPQPAADPAPPHTRFTPSAQPIRDRRFWLLHGLAAHGTIYIDAGAQKALEEKAGLLPVGVVDVEGSFGQQEAVRLVAVERRGKGDGDNGEGGSARAWHGTPVEVGRALVNYSSGEIMRIKGLQSGGIEKVLGYADSEYVALRENISLSVRASRPVSPGIGVVVEAVVAEVAALEG